MAVNIRSVNQILADMMRRVLAETPLTDVSAGSILATILEAAALSDFEISLSVLKLLESSRLESLTGTDLDSRAIEMSVPDGTGGFGRKSATRSNGPIVIGSSFSKLSASLYLAKPAPYAGSTIVYVQDASSWPATGQVYVGRGSLNEEGPLSYSSITFHINYYAVNLNPTNPLLKNHKYEEIVVLAQGGVRTVPAGTRVFVPAIGDTSQIEFSTDSAVTMFDGEDEAEVTATCLTFGETGNVAEGAIKTFASLPFSGATVRNSSSFSNGLSAESDESLRNRIKNHYSSLSRGTAQAIIAALQGLRDPVSGKTITSINLIEPVVFGEAAKCFVDDGSGFEPTIEGQTYESLLENAYGQEILFRTSKFPVASCILTGTKAGPYQLTAGWSLAVKRDQITESFIVRAEDYANINSAQADEIVNAFNSQGVDIGFRTSGNGLYVSSFDLTGDAETLQILSGDLQSLLGFTTEEIRSVFLYKNNELLSFKGRTASLQTAPYPWTSLIASDLSSVVVNVDGVEQSFTVQDADFQSYGTTVSTATLEQWAAVFKTKIAGVNIYPAVTSGGQDVLIWQTWQEQSGDGYLEIVSGNWIGVDKMWESAESATGASADFDFNRISGQIRLIENPSPGDILTLGSELTRASVYSIPTESGSYGAGTSSIGTPTIIIGIDGDFASRELALPTNNLVTATRVSATESLVQLDLGVGGAAYITEMEAGDYVLILSDSTAPSPINVVGVGIYPVKYIDSQYVYIIADDTRATAIDGTTFGVSNNTFIAFKCDGATPQAISFGGGSILTVDDLVTIINSQIIGGEAFKLSPRRFGIRSYSFDQDYSNIALFASVGTAQNIIEPAITASLQPHVASNRSERIDNGGIKVTGIEGPTLPASYYPGRGYLAFSPNYSVISDTADIESSASVTNYPIGLLEAFATGPNYGMVGRSYNNQTAAPFTGFIQSSDVFSPRPQISDTTTESRYEALSLRLEDLPFSYEDSLVVEMDEDPVNGISSILFSKFAYVHTMSNIAVGAKGSQITFTLKDPEDDLGGGTYRPFFDAASVYKDFDFTDFNVLFRPIGFHNVYAPDIVSDLPNFLDKHTFAFYGTLFGPQTRMRMSVVYPTSANSAEQIFHNTYTENGETVCHLYAILPSGNLITSYSKSYTVEAQNLTVTDFNSEIVKLIIRSYDGTPINAGGLYQPGNILVIGGSNQTYSGSFLIESISTTEIHVAAPGVRKSSYPASPVRLEVSSNPLFSLENPGLSMADLGSLISNDYFAGNSVSTIRVVTSDDSVLIRYPTYYVQGKTTAITTLTTVSDSVDYHSVSSNFGSIAHIHTYDNLLNQIVALVQYDDPILPTTSQIIGTNYTYIDEECYLVPASMKALKKWLNFSAVSGFSTKAEISSVQNHKFLQFASLNRGSAGGVRVTGVSANAQDVTLSSVPTESNGGTIKATVEFASAQSLPRGSFVAISNSIPVKIGRAYASVPTNQTGYGVVTAFNTRDASTHFRDTTVVDYERITGSVGKFTFNCSSSGYVAGLSSIEITKISDNIAKVEATGSNNLNARVGDMMVISSDLSQPDYSCTDATGGITDAYVGYPVVHVTSLTEIYVIAPNVTVAPTTITLTAETDLRFVPMIFSEKNIRTNYQPGIKYDTKITGKEKLYYRIKPLGRGLVYAEFSNGDDTTRYDLDMNLAAMGVSSDDWIEFASGFRSENQGKYRIVAHNGTNAIVFFNHNTGGTEELVGNTDYWGMGPIGDNDIVEEDKRHIRIYDKDSVQVGDRLVITSPTTGASWFANSLLGSWTIREIGLEDDYTMYILCDIPSAPSTSQSITLGASAASVYFEESPFAATEYERVFSYKWVVGHAHSTDSIEYADLFLAPQTSIRKMLENYGTKLTALYKLDFSTDIIRGLDAYQYYTELLAQAHQVVDGSSSNPIDYPGVRAVGSAIEILPPLIRSFAVVFTVVPSEGVDLNSIKLPVRSTVTAYVNGLGVGQPVILSEIIRRVQQVPGIKSVIIDSTSPVSVDGVVSTGSYEVARIVDQNDISI